MKQIEKQLTQMKTKVCTKCGKRKKINEFSKRLANKDGLSTWCKKCCAERNKKYREQNKEKIVEQQKKYREENKEKIKKYYEENKEHFVEYQKKYREENKEKIAERDKKYYEENKDKKAGYDKKYRKENKEKITEQKKKYYEENKKEIAKQRKKYREENKEYCKKYREENIVQINNEEFNLNTAPEEIKPAVEFLIKERNLKKIIKKHEEVKK